ncbi:MAG TPA: type II secretion system protein GspM [Aquabacterium sp.]|nr:type II secretion system protein GspM [Aquabacterium sp.]
MADQLQSLQEFWQAWQTKWAAMPARERRLVTIAAWLAGLVLLVMLGIRPALKSLQETPRQLNELNVQLDDMRGQAAEAQVLKQRPPVPPIQAQAALQAATERLGQSGRLMIQGDRATLTANGVSGEALAGWLDEIRSAARAKPVEAALTQSEPGRYSGTITLALGPGADAR